MPGLIQPSFGTQNVKDGEFPFYTSDSSMIDFTRSIVPIGAGSGNDADTLRGFQAVSSTVGGPNKLVATGIDGYISSESVPPSSVTTGGGTYVNNPQFYLALVSEDLLHYCTASVGTDGVIICTPTNGSTSDITLLTDGTNTYWVTFDPVDNVLKTALSTFTTRTTSITLVDTSLISWQISLDTDGVFRTTYLGAL